MIRSRLNSLFVKSVPLKGIPNQIVRTKTTTETGGILGEPPVVRFGLLGIVVTVVAGLLIGAQISKNMANFLEENDLFVPSDDDDDDD